jgi:uncharacterized protein
VVAAQVCLDGPPEVHDRMRPRVGGGSTFWHIVENIHTAVDHLRVTVRMNVDSDNFVSAESLLRILADEGFGGKINLAIGQIVAVDDGAPAPSTQYGTRCFSRGEFAAAEREFATLTREYGFDGPSLPDPIGTPCTAVRANEVVVGSDGELYKCWESVGNPRESTGHIADRHQPNSRWARWISYDPFTDQECRECVALPVCMGGCAHHGMNLLRYEDRCDTFRYSYRQSVEDFIDGTPMSTPVSLTAGARNVKRFDTR